MTKSSVGVRAQHRFEAAAQHVLQGYIQLENHLEAPLGQKGFLQADRNESGEELAGRVRKKLGLPNDRPVQKISEVLEFFGVRIVEVPSKHRIDGLAARLGDEHVVAMNPLLPHDRFRLSATHELGHVLFDDCEVADRRRSDKEREKRAYEFACFLLIPRMQLEEAFKGRSWVRLVEFKQTFGISMAAMIYRAGELKIIPQPTVKRLWKDAACRGWRQNEPGRVRIDRANRFEMMLDEAISTRRLTWSQAERITGITQDELLERVKIAMGIVEHEEEEEEGAQDNVTLRVRFGSA